MSFAAQSLDDIRARLSVSEIVGARVPLKRAGREWRACCPFHAEKTPSFYVNDEKGFYHCFGCGKHGDVISFLIDHDGMHFVDAVENLARKAGVVLVRESKEDRQQRQRLTGLKEIIGRACDWYREQRDGLDGAGVRSYLEKRGIIRKTWDIFDLGYAPPGKTGLLQTLKEEGASIDDLLAAGLVVRPEDDGEAYDRFRGRLMFPIRDQQGACIGFGGRLLMPGEPKYLNSPQTSLFDKGRVLYNADRARSAARRKGRIIVVEGYMDVIALSQAGIDECVAPMGTALTDHHLAVLWKMADEPLLCFDGDEAGGRAAISATMRALPRLRPGKSIRIVTLPQGMDPDDLTRQDGAAGIERMLEQSVSLIDTLWSAEAPADPETPEKRAALKLRMDALCNQINNRPVRNLYKSELHSRMQKLFGHEIRSSLQNFERPNRDSRPRVSARTQTLDACRHLTSRLEHYNEIIAQILDHPELAEAECETLAQFQCPDSALQQLLDAILSAIIEQPGLDKYALATRLEREGYEDTLKSVAARRKLKVVSQSNQAVSHKVLGDKTEGEKGLDDQVGHFGTVVKALQRLSELEVLIAVSESQARDYPDSTEGIFIRQQEAIQEKTVIEKYLIEQAHKTFS